MKFILEMFVCVFGVLGVYYLIHQMLIETSVSLFIFNICLILYYSIYE